MSENQTLLDKAKEYAESKMKLADQMQPIKPPLWDAISPHMSNMIAHAYLAGAGERSIMNKDDFKNAVAEILRKEIYFSGQVGDYVIHGALDSIWELHLKSGENNDLKRADFVDFFVWFRNNGEENIGISIEQFVDKYFEKNPSLSPVNEQREKEVEGLRAKVEFYRTATDKVRELVFNSPDIGAPCQPLYDAIVDKLNEQNSRIKELEEALWNIELWTQELIDDGESFAGNDKINEIAKTALKQTK